MERLRGLFMEAYNHFKNEGHAWLKPQELAKRLTAVKQADSRNEFERRFIYHNPQRINLKFHSPKKLKRILVFNIKILIKNIF